MLNEDEGMSWIIIFFNLSCPTAEETDKRWEPFVLDSFYNNRELLNWHAKCLFV